MTAGACRAALLALAAASTACGPSGGGPGRDLSSLVDALFGGADSRGRCGVSGSAVCGAVRDGQGAAIAMAPVLACTARYCETGKTLGDGTFVVPVADDAADMVVKISEALGASPPRAESVAPIHLPGLAAIEVGVLIAPSLPPLVALAPAAADPQTVMLGEGLTLTMSRADLLLPLGATDDSPSARRLEPAWVPPLPGIDPASIVAVYALAPFSLQSKSRIAVRAPSTLPAGTAVRFRSISEIDGSLSPAARGHADGSAVSTDPGEGITDLTWLVISI